MSHENSETQLLIKSLNGDLTSISFDNPHQSLLSIFLKIWEVCGLQYNHFIFENDGDDGDEKIEITEVHREFDFKNKDEMFLGNEDFFKRKTGSFRLIDLQRFGKCNILFTPKEPNFLVYYQVNKKNKNNKNIMCLDLNDLTYNKNINEISGGYYCGVIEKGGKKIYVTNDHFNYIDINSFTSVHPKAFQSGPNVFQSTFDKVDQYIASRAHHNTSYNPSYLSKKYRTHFSINPFKELLNI